MAIRVLGTDLQPKKKLPYALTKIYGIGLYRAYQICALAKLDPNKRVSELSSPDALTLTNAIGELNYEVQDQLRRKVLMDKRRLISTRAWRGVRAQNGLPCRGQRTRSNAETARRRKEMI
jgi:small subunit ribosomal protein S13